MGTNLYILCTYSHSLSHLIMGHICGEQMFPESLRLMSKAVVWVRGMSCSHWMLQNELCCTINLKAKLSLLKKDKTAWAGSSLLSLDRHCLWELSVPDFDDSGVETVPWHDWVSQKGHCGVNFWKESLMWSSGSITDKGKREGKEDKRKGVFHSDKNHVSD